MEVLALGFLWRIGGHGWKPLGKDWRRIVAVLVIFLSCLWRGYPAWQSMLCAAPCFFVFRLPLTLIGSSLYDHWINWPWQFIVGYLCGLPAVAIHGWAGFALAGIPAIAQGASITLSNIQGLPAKTWTHEACEVLIGCSVAGALFCKP